MFTCQSYDVKFPKVEVAESQPLLNVTALLNRIPGVIVEIGGPTPRGYTFVDIKKLQKKIHVSNLLPGLVRWIPEQAGKVVTNPDGSSARPFRPGLGRCDFYDSPTHLEGRTDFLADGRQLPFADKSVGAVMASCLTSDVRPSVLREIRRVLRPKGVLVWRGAFADDFAIAKTLGFKLLKTDGYEVVFRGR